MRTELIKIRLFVEGVYVPWVSQVNVQTYANEVARASFALPPVPGFETEELVRARVHMFWSDIDTRAEHDNDDWPLLFEGEIVADSYNKSPTSRSQMFQCSGYHTYWEQVQLYNYDLSAGMTSNTAWTDRISLALGNSTFEFESPVAGVNLRQRLASEIEAASRDKDYHSVVRAIFGDALRVNHFFERSDAALALSSRFATPRDENIDVLLTRNVLSEALNKDVLSIGGERSMMETLKATLALFRYQIVCNAQPPLLDDRVGERRVSSRISRDVDTVTERFRSYLQSLSYPRQAPAVGDKYLDDVPVAEVLDLVDGTSGPDAWLKAAGVVTRAFGIPESDAARSDDDKAFAESLITDITTYVVSLSNAADATISGDDPLDRNEEFGDLLAQFLILPETHFALPPTCNVFFPQDQTSLGIQRQLMQEPTRGLGMPTSEADFPYRLFMVPDTIAQARVPPTTVSPVSAAGFHRPVRKEHRVSSGYGWRHIRQKTLRDDGTRRVLHPDGAKFHHGIDIARKYGTTKSAFVGTPVHAFDDGVVELAGWQNPKKPRSGYGQRVRIRHANGMKTTYGHLYSITVRPGQEVKGGDVIGGIGNTGSSTGPHLHFEIRINRKSVDPLPLIEAVSEDGDTNAAPAQPVAATAEAATADVEAQDIKDAASSSGATEPFTDFTYLTPEEEIRGIVPFFDHDVTRKHARLVFDGQEESSNEYIRQMLETEYYQRRFQTRTLDTMNMPFNPNPVAGFPGLVVDRNRSFIGLVSSVSHTIAVGGGQGSASTTVSIDSPRYWDEGDPYHWVGGVADSQKVVVNQVERLLPKGFVAPTYYLTSLVGTNSTNRDNWWSDSVHNDELKPRPVDRLYSSLLGKGVRGIPYQYATRPTNQGNVVAYNKAIDSRRAPADGNNVFAPKPPNKNTVVGRYYWLVDKNPALAEEYVRSLTRRRGVSERNLMSAVLGATTGDNGFTYTADAFRPVYQATVQRMNAILNEAKAFKG